MLSNFQILSNAPLSRSSLVWLAEHGGGILRSLRGWPSLASLSINRSSNFTFFWSPTIIANTPHPAPLASCSRAPKRKTLPRGEELAHIEESRHTHLERRSGPRHDIPVCPRAWLPERARGQCTYQKGSSNGPSSEHRSSFTVLSFSRKLLILG